MGKLRNIRYVISLEDGGKWPPLSEVHRTGPADQYKPEDLGSRRHQQLPLGRLDTSSRGLFPMPGDTFVRH